MKRKILYSVMMKAKELRKLTKKKKIEMAIKEK